MYVKFKLWFKKHKNVFFILIITDDSAVLS